VRTQHEPKSAALAVRSCDGVQVMNTTRFPKNVCAALAVAPILLAFLLDPVMAAEPAMHDHMAAENPADQNVTCIPVAERVGRKLGCFVTHTETLGKLPKVPLYWHLYKYKTREAADSAKETYSSVVESYGVEWLFTIAAATWHAKGGEKVAMVGPLPISDAASYTAEYMEATFVPGMRSMVHRHPGPEAWYVLSGEQCLETPGRRTIVRAKESSVVPEGPPVALYGSGDSERRSLVLVLHDSSKPRGMPASDWKPSGLCTGAAENAGLNSQLR
jgi:quercetin dioxygenase-like cupin family protein